MFPFRRSRHRKERAVKVIYLTLKPYMCTHPPCPLHLASPLNTQRCRDSFPVSSWKKIALLLIQNWLLESNQCTSPVHSSIAWRRTNVFRWIPRLQVQCSVLKDGCGFCRLSNVPGARRTGKRCFCFLFPDEMNKLKINQHTGRHPVDSELLSRSLAGKATSAITVALKTFRYQTLSCTPREASSLWFNTAIFFKYISVSVLKTTKKSILQAETAVLEAPAVIVLLW